MLCMSTALRRGSDADWVAIPKLTHPVPVVARRADRDQNTEIFSDPVAQRRGQVQPCNGLHIPVAPIQGARAPALDFS